MNSALSLTVTFPRGKRPIETSKALWAELGTIFPAPTTLNSEEKLALLKRDDIVNRLTEYASELYETREAQMGAENMRILERLLTMRSIDMHWVNHLTAIDNLRQGIGSARIWPERPPCHVPD